MAPLTTRPSFNNSMRCWRVTNGDTSLLFLFRTKRTGTRPARKSQTSQRRSEMKVPALLDSRERLLEESFWSIQFPETMNYSLTRSRPSSAADCYELQCDSDTIVGVDGQFAAGASPFAQN